MECPATQRQQVHQRGREQIAKAKQDFGDNKKDLDSALSMSNQRLGQPIAGKESGPPGLPIGDRPGRNGGRGHPDHSNLAKQIFMWCGALLAPSESD